MTIIELPPFKWWVKKLRKQYPYLYQQVFGTKPENQSIRKSGMVLIVNPWDHLGARKRIPFSTIVQKVKANYGVDTCDTHTPIRFAMEPDTIWNHVPLKNQRLPLIVAIGDSADPVPRWVQISRHPEKTVSPVRNYDHFVDPHQAVVFNI